MKVSFLLIFACLFTLHTFCQTADVKEGCAPLTVAFQAPTSAVTYFWDFKDGVTSDKQNPTNIFTKPGTYQVSFQQQPGGPATIVEVKVYDLPTLKINTLTGCAPFAAAFENQSSLIPAIKISNYTWIFGDGQSYQGLDNPRHLYATPGKYNPSLTIETNIKSCNLTVAFEGSVTVVPAPVASFTTDPLNTNSCKDTLNVNFNNTSVNAQPANYKWTLGNGNTSDSQQPSGPQRYVKGKYNATLLATFPAIAGCSTQTSKSISAGAPDPKIIFSPYLGLFENDTTCFGNTIRIRTDVQGFYNWNFGPGTSPGVSIKDTNLVKFNTAGLHRVTLTYTTPDRLCTAIKIDTIFVDSVTAIIQSDPFYSCTDPGKFEFKGVSNQSGVAYNWLFSDRTTATTQNVVHQFSTNTDSYYYGRNVAERKITSLVVVSNTSGCSAQDTILNILHLPNALFMADTVRGCAPLTVVMSDSSTARDKIVSWQWLFDDNAVVTNPDRKAVAHTYLTEGEYKPRLIITTERGCIDTSYAVLIEVGKDLSSQVNFTTDKSEACPGEPVTFSFAGTAATQNLIDSYHYSTERNRSTHCGSDNKLTYTYTHEAGPQSVGLTVDYNGCYTTINKPAFVNVKGAIAKIDMNMLCNAPMTYNFNSLSQQASTLNWEFGDGAIANTISVPHTFSAVGDYTVKLTATNAASGCTPTVQSVVVKARQLQSNIAADTLLCINADYLFNGASSRDVLADCYSGYTWQFPGKDLRPHTSSLPATIFRFTTAGNHTARLITKDINGCKDTVTINFKVYDIAVKPTSDKVSICNPAEVKFSDLSISDTTMRQWQWYFGDGLTASIQSPVHSYLNAPLMDSTYFGRLVITDILGCKDSTAFTLRHYIPSSKIVITDPTLCAGDSANVSATDFTTSGSVLSYLWDFGNGNTSILQKNKVLYDTARNYSVKLVFTELSSGCQGNATAAIQVQNYPKANFTTDVDTLGALCAPQNVTFKDASQSNSALTYNWTFGNQQTSSSANPNNLFKTTYRKGNFNAVYKVSTSFGCSDSKSRTFNVFSPEGDFDIVPNKIICKGDSLTFRIKGAVDVSSFTWAFGDGNVLNDVNQTTHKYNFHPPGGQTFARLVLRGENGICPVVVQKPVFIQQVIADFERLKGDSDTSICFVEGNYHLKNTSTSFSSFKWFLGDGETSVENEVDHKFAAPGIYNVKLTVTNNTAGCVDTIIKQAVVNKNPIVEAVGDTVCFGKDSLRLFVSNPVASSYYHYELENVQYQILSPKINFPPTFTRSGKFIETDTNGCKGSANAEGVVISPSNFRNLDTSIVIGDQISLPVSGPNVYKYTWTPETGLSCLQCNNPQVRPLENVTYQLQVRDILGCFNSFNTFKVSIRPETFIKLPSAFTPNGDSQNDIVYVKGWGIKDLLDFKIFNRWGQLVFETSDLDSGWDGKLNGVLQNSDVYVYKVRVRTWRETELFNEGYINLIY